MKTPHIMQAALAVLLLLTAQATWALGGNIMGQVTDPETKEPVSDATVILTCQDNESIFYTNEKGYFYASNIAPGSYTITVSYLSKHKTLPDEIKLANNEDREVNIAFSAAQTITTVYVEGEKSRKPLLDKFNPMGGAMVKEDIDEAPITKVDDIPQLLNVPQINGKYYVSGAREGSLVYYIDDCRVMGSPNIPMNGVEMVRSYTHHLPARYGDTTGGVIAIDTRSWFTE